MTVLVAVRSRIVLLAGEGKQNKQIGERLGISTRMVALWWGRFLLRGGGIAQGCTPARSYSVD